MNKYEDQEKLEIVQKAKKWLGIGFWVLLGVLAVLVGDEWTIVGIADDFLIPPDLAGLTISGFGYLLLRKLAARKAKKLLEHVSKLED